MRNNYHTHTNRCLHAYGTDEEYILRACEGGMTELGFSDHGPFPDKDYGLRMQYGQLDEYISSLDRLKEKYKDRLNILKGLEIEYYPAYNDYYRVLLDEKRLDYLALGAHSFIDRNGEFKNIFFADDTDTVLDYAKNVCQAIETGFFRFVAHPDIFFLNDLPVDDNIERACAMMTDCAAEHDMILEYNANGYRRARRMYRDGFRYPYPHEAFWRAAAEKNIRAIIGSDCHAPDQVCDESFIYAEKKALQLGLRLCDCIF